MKEGNSHNTFSTIQKQRLKRVLEERVHVNQGGAPYLDVAGLFHEPAGILRGSVAFRQLHSEELESALEIGLQKVLFGSLQ